MQTQDNREKPDVNEQYSVAMNATNLKVEMDSERRSQADILMAASWSASRLGGALLRLHSEWDSVQHPKMPTVEQIAKLAKSLDNGQESKSHYFNLAREMSHKWHSHEMGLMLGRLKSFPQVRQVIAEQADRWGMGKPLDISADVIRWWLYRCCPVCGGTKFQHIPGTGRLSSKICKSCRGTGESAIPKGEAGRKVASWLDECTNIARSQIKKRLHAYRKGA